MKVLLPVLALLGALLAWPPAAAAPDPAAGDAALEEVAADDTPADSASPADVPLLEPEPFEPAPLQQAASDPPSGDPPPSDPPASTRTAAVDKPAWLPGISSYMRTGMGAYRSSACPCIDRSTWNLELGAHLRLHRFVGFDAEYRYGTILLGGNFPFSGYAVGYRTGLTPEPTRWWNDFFLRTGMVWMSIMGTRDDSYLGLYVHPGWSVNLFPLVYLETELSVSYIFGAMEHLNLGFRGGIRVGF